MTVKEKRGRRRYIYFQTADGTALPHEAMLLYVVNAASQGGARSIKLIQFDGRRGIVRCSLKEAALAIAAINSPGRPFVTLCTSGTLRTLRERYFPDQLRKRPREGGAP